MSEPAGSPETAARSCGLRKRPAIFDNLVLQVSCIKDLMPLTSVWVCFTREREEARRRRSGHHDQRQDTSLRKEKGNIVLLPLSQEVVNFASWK